MRRRLFAIRDGTTGISDPPAASYDSRRRARGAKHRVRNFSFLLFFPFSATLRACMGKPEDQARQKIDKLLANCSWIIQNRTINLTFAA
jgi:hypothetical protein